MEVLLAVVAAGLAAGSKAPEQVGVDEHVVDLIGPHSGFAGGTNLPDDNVTKAFAKLTVRWGSRDAAPAAKPAR